MSTVDIRLDLRRGDFGLTVDLALPGRGITGLFGRSGSGKTSLLRAVCGLDKARGLISVNGARWLDSAQGVSLPAHRRRVGYVFQDTALFTHLDVAGNLDYGWTRTPAPQRRLAREQVIDWLGIGPLLRRRPSQLSGGEGQRVAMARALLTSPDLLLLDEPLAALDMQAKREILPYLERMHRELRIPVLYVSHAIDEVIRLADHLVVLDQGRVSASGALTELLTRLDLPLSHTEEAAAIIDARVSAADTEFGLTYFDTAAGRITLAASGLPVGEERRVRIAARDVGLALQAPADTSILNCLPATVADIAEHGPAQVMVRLDAGGTPLLARITRKSRQQLGLEPGRPVFALVKSVALAD